MFTIVDVNSKFWIQTRVVIYGLVCQAKYQDMLSVWPVPST